MRHRPPRVARATLRAEVDHGQAELVGDPDRPRGWTLLINGTAQSHVDLDEPDHLEFEYVRRLGHLMDVMAPPAAPLRAAHLGGGAWTVAPPHAQAVRLGPARCEPAIVCAPPVRQPSIRWLLIRRTTTFGRRHV